MCDFTPHCLHGEDEAGCRKMDVYLNLNGRLFSSHPLLCHSATECDFDGGSCGWYELTLGDGFDWVWGISAELPPHLYGDPPPLDHTTNSTEGKGTFVLLQKFLFCLFFFFFKITICCFQKDFCWKVSKVYF